MTANTETAIAILAAAFCAGSLFLMGLFMIVAMAREDARLTASKTRALPSGRTLLVRALRRQCPACGRGRTFRSYFQMNGSCSGCGTVFWSNPGEWTGPSVIDFIVAAASAMMVWAVLEFFGFSQAAQLALVIAFAVSVTIALSPWSRSLWTTLLYVCGEMEAHDDDSNSKQ